MAALETAMAAYELPTGVTGAWRLPTLEEAGIFTQDTQVVSFVGGKSPSYFCLDDNVLNWAYTKKTDSTTELKYNTNYNSSVILRPVIDITYQ